MCPPRRSTLRTFKYAQPSSSSRNCGPPSTLLYSGVSNSSIPCYLIFKPKPQHTQKHTFLTPHQIESLSFVNPSFQTLQGTLLSKDHLLAQPLLNIVITSTWKGLYLQSSSLVHTHFGNWTSKHKEHKDGGR